MKKITILGSTGSIGTQSLDVIKNNRDLFQIEGLTCGSNIQLLSKQIREFSPEFVAVSREEDARTLKKSFPETEVYYGRKGLIEAATGNCDMVLNSLMGMRGLEPTYHAIMAGKDIALANKETLVAGGELVMNAVREKGVKLLPVDSEHSAIFQCLEGNKDRKIKRILLTASGGPFRGCTKEDLENVTLKKALKHPKWTMGQKITIDSATMMNKGLEVIEARWLFDVEPKKIQILVHPQSVVHSAVEFEDNSVIAQLGVPDMRIPISLAIGYPNRLANPDESLDFFGQGSNLTFERPNPEVFTCIKMAYDAIEKGGSYPVVLNGANEVLVEYFLNEKIRFIDIQNILSEILDRHKVSYGLSLEDTLKLDAEIRSMTRRMIEKQ